MHKHAFQGLKRTFLQVSNHLHHILIKNQLIKSLGFYHIMHVSGFSPPYFDKKKPFYKVIGYLKQNMVGEDLRHL